MLCYFTIEVYISLLFETLIEQVWAPWYYYRTYHSTSRKVSHHVHTLSAKSQTNKQQAWFIKIIHHSSKHVEKKIDLKQQLNPQQKKRKKKTQIIWSIKIIYTNLVPVLIVGHIQKISTAIQITWLRSIKYFQILFDLNQMKQLLFSLYFLIYPIKSAYNTIQGMFHPLSWYSGKIIGSIACFVPYVYFKFWVGLYVLKVSSLSKMLIILE